MIHDVTPGIGSTVARINTHAVDTRIISCAFAVRYALRHNLRYNGNIIHMYTIIYNIAGYSNL